MQYTNGLTAKNHELIAEAQRLRLRLQQALEELEEVRDQVDRRRREGRRIRDANTQQTAIGRVGPE